MSSYQHRIGNDGAAQHRSGDAQPLEHREHVRAELDPVTDHAEFGRALDQLHPEPGVRERQRGRRAADAAAGHDDWAIGICHRAIRRFEGPHPGFKPIV
jgi:hypothetical protein